MGGHSNAVHIRRAGSTIQNREQPLPVARPALIVNWEDLVESDRGTVADHRTPDAERGLPKKPMLRTIALWVLTWWSFAAIGASFAFVGILSSMTIAPTPVHLHPTNVLGRWNTSVWIGIAEQFLALLFLTGRSELAPHGRPVLGGACAVLGAAWVVIGTQAAEVGGVSFLAATLPMWLLAVLLWREMAHAFEARASLGAKGVLFLAGALLVAAPPVLSFHATKAMIRRAVDDIATGRDQPSLERAISTLQWLDSGAPVCRQLWRAYDATSDPTTRGRLSQAWTALGRSPSIDQPRLADREELDGLR